MIGDSKSVCIYCGANSGNSENIVQQSKILTEDLARMGFDLVYGGGKDGLMKLTADIFLAHNRKVTGIRPEKLIKDEALHTGISEIEIVPNMYVRKARMIELSDYLIALPGGVGTIDEIMDAFAEIKLGFIDKPLILLNTDGYYDGLKSQLQKMVDLGFLKKEDQKWIQIVNSPIDVIRCIEKSMDLSKEIDKIAFIKMNNHQILTTLSHGKSAYYLPGGKRDKGESDHEALVREAMEELTININSDTIQYIGTYRAQADGKPNGTLVKMTCYTAEYQGNIKADNEIAEAIWMNYSDREKVSHVDKIIFDDLNNKGLLK